MYRDLRCTARSPASISTGARHAPAVQPGWIEDPDAPELADCARQLREYFAGKRRATSTCRSPPRGTAFQQRVWEAIARIPFGETITYAELARACGRAGRGARRGRRHRAQSDRRSSCPATAWWEATAASPATPAASQRKTPPARARGRAARLARLRPADLARLVALAAMWGASYLFMRYAVPYFGPVLLIELRVLVAGLALARLRRGERRARGLEAALARVPLRGLGRAWRRPSCSSRSALTVIDASTAAILNALSPLFASIVAAVWIRDPLTPAKVAGIALCLVGTAVLVGWTPSPMSRARALRGRRSRWPPPRSTATRSCSPR